MNKKVKILLIQLGSPKSTEVSDIRSYLREFLSERRVVDLNPIFWKIILNLFILPFRPAKVAVAYRRIFDGISFPLVKYTELFKTKLQKELGDKSVDIETAYLLNSPRIPDVLNRLKAQGDCESLLVVPMFPQYCGGTTALTFDRLRAGIKSTNWRPNLFPLTTFHRFKSFIDAEVELIDSHLAGRSVDALILSFHGIPKRRVIEGKDPYYDYCYETYLLIKERVKSLHASNIYISFQSRFGKDEWLTPYSDELARELIKGGKKNIAIHSPSFLIDCLETTDELGHGLALSLKESGGELQFIPSLNDNDSWVFKFSSDLLRLVNKEVVPQYSVPKENIPACRYLGAKPLTKEAKASLKAVFVTLFIDLVGFSIIFPLFPALAKYYMSFNGELLFPAVLFGGALGALYSLLQFFFSPIWGALSDKIGRKRSLKITVWGTLISYLLWAFSNHFALFLVARILAGVMGGNISVATAAVSDITTKENRSKGMAFIGIAFALGFILGPAIGGFLSLIDLTQYESFSWLPLTPFSMPALFAAGLAAFNLYQLRKFPDLSPKDERRKIRIIPHFLENKIINRIGLTYFLYLLAFSGMEFTLAFLASDRLGFSPKDNGMMFVWVGFVLAMTQGGFVQRKAHAIGEKKLALTGLLTIIPGLLLISLTKSTFVLYFALLFLAIGSAMVIPTLTALASFEAKESEQGESMGFFRSMGSLARLFGPLWASLVYFKLGSWAPYSLGAFLIMIPFLLLFKTETTNLLKKG